MIGLGQLPHVRVGDRPMVPEVAVERFIEVASAASIGTQTALRIFTQIVAALQEAPHVKRRTARDCPGHHRPDR
jgi:hypothetical protein